VPAKLDKDNANISPILLHAGNAIQDL